MEGLTGTTAGAAALEIVVRMPLGPCTARELAVAFADAAALITQHAPPGVRLRFADARPDDAFYGALRLCWCKADGAEDERRSAATEPRQPREADQAE